MDDSEIEEAAASEPLDETAPDDASSGDEARSVADWTDAALETGFFGASAENADFASRPELSDEREEAVDRAFAVFAERSATSEAEALASEEDKTRSAATSNSGAPVAVEETSDETEVAERERKAALDESEKARRAEELEERKRLDQYDASPERLSKYDR